MTIQNGREGHRLVIFSNWNMERSCIHCPQFPLCVPLSYKEIAIIQLFQRFKENGRQAIPFNEVYSEFLKQFKLELDEEDRFRTILNKLAFETGILLRIVSDSNNDSSRKRLGKREVQCYQLNPSMVIEPIDLKTLEFFCAIGLDRLSYQIVELLNHKSPLTLDQLQSLLQKKKSDTMGKKTLRRRINRLRAVNLIFAEAPGVNKPDLLYVNEGHQLVNRGMLHLYRDFDEK